MTIKMLRNQQSFAPQGATLLLWTLGLVSAACGGVSKLKPIDATDEGGNAGAGGAGGMGGGGNAGGSDFRQDGGPSAGAGAMASAGGHSGAAGAGNTGGSGGATPACYGKVKAVDASGASIGTFDTGTVAPWFFFSDLTGTFTSGVTQPGAESSSYSAHMSGQNLTTWGAGLSLRIPCSDVSAFSGITFWARSDLASPMGLDVPTSATMPVADGGDCTADCYAHYGTHVALGQEWAQYAVPFSALRQPDWGARAQWDGVIFAVTFTGLATFDVWVDQVAFYAGSPPPGAIGP